MSSKALIFFAKKKYIEKSKYAVEFPHFYKIVMNFLSHKKLLVLLFECGKKFHPS
jgi:hypothetical protein